MGIDAVFDVTLEILRASLTDPAAVDEWNRPTRAADAIVATVDGHVEPLSLREQATLADAGAVIADSVAYLYATDLLASDRIRIVERNETYEVRSVEDAGGAGDHLEALLHRVSR